MGARKQSCDDCVAAQRLVKDESCRRRASYSCDMPVIPAARCASQTFFSSRYRSCAEGSTDIPCQGQTNTAFTKKKIYEA